MENFVADQIRVNRNVIAVDTEAVPVRNVLTALSRFNIESAVWNARTAKFSGILYCARKTKVAAQIPLDIRKNGVDAKCSIRCRTDLTLISVLGLYIGGKDGLAQRVMEQLLDANVNIEYQVLFPSQYSFLISTRKARVVVAHIANALKVQDTSVVQQ